MSVHKKQSIMQAIRRGYTTGPSIARRLGLGLNHIVRQLKSMERERLVVRDGLAKPEGGRPPAVWRLGDGLNPEAALRKAISEQQS